MDFLFILVGPNLLVYISMVVYCSLGPVLVIRYVILVILFAISMALFALKKGELITFRLG